MRWLDGTPRLNGHEFKQALGDGEGQGSLVYRSPRDHESDMTEQLKNNNNKEPCWLNEERSGKI